jgi:hypothetical protein
VVENSERENEKKIKFFIEPKAFLNSSSRKQNEKTKKSLLS